MNHTSVTEFILLGLTQDPQLQIMLFLLFLFIYIITLVANIGIAALIVLNSSLKSPMYFFLCNLSVSDVFYSTVIIPRMLKDLLSESKSISFIGCVAQMYFFVMFGGIETYLLTVMAYDRYAAICHPLRYHLIISRSMCIKLLTVTFLAGVICAAMQTGSAFNGSFCGQNVIDHFYCDTLPVMKLFCTSRFVNEITFLAAAVIFGCGSLLTTVASYIYVISTILQIPSTEGRLKTFSTCGSHITALSLFYGTTLFAYLRLPGSGSIMQKKVVSVFYTCVIPMLNPMIYSLRNKEVKTVIWKVVQWKVLQH